MAQYGITFECEEGACCGFGEAFEFVEAEFEILFGGSGFRCRATV